MASFSLNKNNLTYRKNEFSQDQCKVYNNWDCLASSTPTAHLGEVGTYVRREVV